MTVMEKERKVLGEPKHLSTGAELVEFMDVNDILFHMTEKEAQVLLSYMAGHDYLIGELEGKLYRGDLCNEKGGIIWIEYSIDEMVNVACEWNYDMIVDTREGMANPDNFIDYANKKTRYDFLKRDEKVLDSMFERTIYGKVHKKVYNSVETKVVEVLQNKDRLDELVKKISDAIAEGTEMLQKELQTAELKTGRVR